MPHRFEMSDTRNFSEWFAVMNARLRMVSLGHSNRQIADALFVSEAAIKARIKNMLTKLDAVDRTHAVTVALRRGILD